MSRRSTIVTWTGWILLTIVATAAMVHGRGAFDQVHVVLVYLLLVLGASASGGRALGVTIACAGFVLIDYFFQPPYGQIGIGKPLDWVALIAFLVTAVVSTQLLARAQMEAEEARRRATEVSSLARLGSETLSAGRAEDALARVADVIRSTLGVHECAIIAWDPERGFRRRDPDPPLDAAEQPILRAVIERGALGWVRAGGDVAFAPPQMPLMLPPSTGEPIEKILIPLAVQDRIVGVLRMADRTPMQLDLAQRRFLDAIVYYAALAVDRVRLVAQAEHAEALREADRLKDIVLASVSHDLRTPLTTIKALAQSQALQGNSAAAAIDEQADRLTRLVSDLLDLSRLKGGAFAATPELNTAEDLIGAAVRQTQGLFSERPLRTIIDLDSPALVGHFDFSQSLRVLCNLLENAARHSPAHDPIELGARREGPMLVFTVADRGPGIDALSAPHIFEPFYRAPGSAPDTGRAGLGLSIARTLAEIQGGALGYSPREGGGSVFALSLPATELRADALEPGA
jgi:two-component system sensor histidine kinase KdpD